MTIRLMIVSLMFVASVVNGQVVVKMEMPAQPDQPLAAMTLFDESLWINIPNALGPMGFDISGGSPPYTFQWMENGTVFSTDATVTFTPQQGGSYTVTILDGNNCAVTMPLTTQNLTNIDSEANEEQVFSASYLKETSILRLFLSLPPERAYSLQVYDLHGRVLFEKEVTDIGDVPVTLSSGLYIVSLSGEETGFTTRIVVL